MGKVVMDMSMSLDGFIAAPHDSPEQPLGEGGGRLHEWLFNESEYARAYREAAKDTGAVIMGRRTFNFHPSGPYGLPAFVLTHNPKGPEESGTNGSAVTFVADGIESALRQATDVAGDKIIGLIGANMQQQYLSAGLVDEIHIHLISVLFGGGIRLFDHIGAKPIALEQLEVIESPRQRILIPRRKVVYMRSYYETTN